MSGLVGNSRNTFSRGAAHLFFSERRNRILIISYNCALFSVFIQSIFIYQLMSVADIKL